MGAERNEGEPSAEPGRSFLIVGLGNPGDDYRDTRHNCGFWVVDRLQHAHGLERWAEECSALLCRGAQIDLAKPQTFMNRSGYAVRCLVETYGYGADDVLVVMDDIELPLGALRLRAEGGPGGHRGLESVITSMRTDSIARLRIGIAPRERPLEGELADFVLEPFDPEERLVVDRAVAKAAEACLAWVTEGVDRAMNRFNGPAVAARSES